MRWQRCLQLLPPDAQQYAGVYQRLMALAQRGHATPSHAGGTQINPAGEESTFVAILKTGGSMLISIVVYAFALSDVPLMESLLFATGFVVLILIHELGHVAAMRYYGLSASPPIFIPFVGALIRLREQPENAKVEAIIGIAGPIAGTLGALACFALYLRLPLDAPVRELVLLLSLFGFFLNLINLLPLPPLDGGRVTAALSPRIWVLGIAGLVGWLVRQVYNNGTWDGRPNFILILLLVLALPRIIGTLTRRGKPSPYYAVTRRATWTIGTIYVVLGLGLYALFWYTRNQLPSGLMTGL
jgi:Zn-dependent protease